MLSVLITQCLQRDFVEPLTAHAPLPNKLHVGYQEAQRLWGQAPGHGPIAQLMSWARSQPAEQLAMVHICDSHDPRDPAQSAHLAQFGAHCIAGTRGAEVFFGDEAHEPGPNERTVHSLALNDFEGTQLGDTMQELKARAGAGGLRVGVVGVWTEAKVTFLLYDLKTRCGIDALATSSALTASASRSQHFNALAQLQRILGVEVFDSVGDFASWLVPGSALGAQVSVPAGLVPRLQIAKGGDLQGIDRDILGQLFRESAEVSLVSLSGGFSGASVYQATARDALGHQQAPSVVKLGSRALIGKERAAFERVEEILGNDAPRVRCHIELGDRAGLKYAYAAMGNGGVRTFQSLYKNGAPPEQIEPILRTVFDDILGRFYRAAHYERLPLLEYYGFSPKWAPSVRAKVHDLVGNAAGAATLHFPGHREVKNLCHFYEEFLPNNPGSHGEYHYASYVHGDLNGANILVDGRQNVWVIDFFHTQRGHVLQDLAKLENDLLYIYTPLEDEAELDEALEITNALRQVTDLRAAWPEQLPQLTRPHLQRAWRTVRLLRGVTAGLVREDRSPWQMHVAALRYAAHTLSFDESSPLQTRWALFSACSLAEEVASSSRRDDLLRVDWLRRDVAGGRIGLTLCPGRRDRGRVLARDLETLGGLGVAHIVSLLTEEELRWAGVSDFHQVVADRGFDHYHLPIPDQEVPTISEARALVAKLRTWLGRGEHVVVHCLGGLGRSGTLAACLLVAEGMDADAAVECVRASRDRRAVESQNQERFVRAFAEGRSEPGSS